MLLVLLILADTACIAADLRATAYAATRPESLGLAAAIHTIDAQRIVPQRDLAAVIGTPAAADRLRGGSAGLNQIRAVGIGAALLAGLLVLAIVALRRQIAQRKATEAMLRQRLDDLQHEVAERSDALAAARTYHGDFAEIAEEWFWQTDAERRFTFLSDRFAEATEIPIDAFVGRTPEELLGVDIQCNMTEIRDAVVARRPFANVVQRVQFADGRRRFWRLSGKPIFDPDSRAFAGYRGSGSEVTKPTETEITLSVALSRAESADQQARQDRARLLEAIEIMPAGFALWDRNDQLEMCNARYREINRQMADIILPGLSFEELLRRSAERGQAARGDMDVEAWVAQRLASHRAPSGAFVERRDDGCWIQVEERLNLAGGVVGAYGDVTQITLARSRAEAAEEEARRDRARLVDAINAIPAGFALWDVEERLVLCNARYREIYPLTADLMVPGAHYEKLVREGAVRRGQSLADPDAVSWVAQHLAMRQLVRSSAPGVTLHDEKLQDGRWVQVDEQATRDGDIVAIHTDVTERRKREASEHEREKLAALGHLAGGVAHEINNLLQPAVIFPELVAERLPASDVESRTDLAAILDGARKTRDIVKNILRFARKEELALEPLDLVAEIKATLAFVRDLIPPSVEITEALELAPTAQMVAANKTQLVQVITNLVVNAAHAMQDRGTITVAATNWRPTAAEAAQLEIEAGATYLAVSITDTGSGMDAAIQARIFEPFFTTKPIGQGTGLGLSVVYGILKSWKGAITVASEAGHGATFTLYIPLRASEAAAWALTGS